MITPILIRFCPR